MSKKPKVILDNVINDFYLYCLLKVVRYDYIHYEYK